MIKESPEYRHESLLLGEIAGEIHDIGRRLCGAELREEGDSEGTRPLSADEAAQWKLHLEEEEDEARQAVATLENRTPTAISGRSPSSSADSHRSHSEHLALTERFVPELPGEIVGKKTLRLRSVRQWLPVRQMKPGGQ